MTDTEQRKASKEFVALWKDRGDEKQETQQFWSDLLHRVFSITDFSKRVMFEKRVPLLHTSFIDVYIPETKVLIEQKSMDVDLLKKKKQSDGSELNPFEQAQRYGGKLPYSERPRWIVTCNFQKFLIYDMDAVRPEEKPIEILLDELPDKYHLLSFLIDSSVKKITVEQELSFQAGELVGKLYDLMLPQYKDPTAESTLQALNKFCVRIVFCLYAEDAMLFGSKGSEFHDYLSSFLPENRRDALIKLFRMLDTKEDDRDAYESQKLLDFPYVNGGLFAGDIEIPQLTDEICQLILEDMSEKLDWSKISPTIFGAVFESTLNPETRRSGGMHYTSIRDIHKVIDPLFLNDLQTEFDDILHNPKLSNPKRKASLEAFQNRLSQVHFLDPACGSGNFLTETYLSIRRLENKVIEHLLKGMMVLEFANPVKVSIGQFAGIEINDFAVTVARTALWIAESQMIKETEAIVNQTIDFFPLKTDAKIVEGNALRMDWNEVISKYACTYIMGNPPFSAGRRMTEENHNDLISVAKDFQKNGELDFVAAWFIVAAKYMDGTKIKCGFVATSSISQGEQVVLLWKPLFEKYHVNIFHAVQPFNWKNEAKKSAGVHCVIIEFTVNNTVTNKTITNEEQTITADNINGYLMPNNNLWIEGRKNPISNVPNIANGSKPLDNAICTFTPEEKEEFLKKAPDTEPYFYRYMGSREFINNIERWFLFINRMPPQVIKHNPLVLEKIEAIRNYRLSSKSKQTIKLAETPTKFHYENIPKHNFLVIPQTSSGRRKYVPIGFLTPDILVNNKLQVMQEATLYEFGILSSNVHNAWLRTVAGRFRADFTYSVSVVYNTFPWPVPTDQQHEKIEKTAQGILDARLKYSGSSLADLYDSSSMPDDLLMAHKANDRAVMEAYGFRKDISESECVAELFRMYQDLTKEK